MKESKWNDKLKNHNNSCDPPFFEMVLSVVSTLLSLNHEPQSTHHTCCGCVVDDNHGVAHLQWTTTNTQQRHWKHQFMNHKKDKETMEWRVWFFFLPKTLLFTLQTLSWLSLHSLTTTLSLLSVGDSICGKANTSVMSVLFWEAPDDGCLDGVDEPQWATSQPQHPPCVPSCFSLLVLSIHIHPTNGVHVVVSPMVCSSIQPMPCPTHLFSNTITLSPLPFLIIKAWCDKAYNAFETPATYECDGCGMTSRPKPICVCDGFCTMTTSTTTCQHHHPHSPFHPSTCFLSYTYVSVPHVQGMSWCVVLAQNNCWRPHHHTHFHTTDHQTPTTFSLLTLTQHTLTWDHSGTLPISLFKGYVVGTVSAGALTEVHTIDCE